MAILKKNAQKEIDQKIKTITPQIKDIIARINKFTKEINQTETGIKNIRTEIEGTMKEYTKCLNFISQQLKTNFNYKKITECNDYNYFSDNTELIKNIQQCREYLLEKNTDSFEISCNYNSVVNKEYTKLENIIRNIKTKYINLSNEMETNVKAIPSYVQNQLKKIKLFLTEKEYNTINIYMENAKQTAANHLDQLKNDQDDYNNKFTSSMININKLYYNMQTFINDVKQNMKKIENTISKKQEEIESKKQEEREKAEQDDLNTIVQHQLNIKKLEQLINEYTEYKKAITNINTNFETLKKKIAQYDTTVHSKVNTLKDRQKKLEAKNNQQQIEREKPQLAKEEEIIEPYEKFNAEYTKMANNLSDNIQKFTQESKKIDENIDAANKLLKSKLSKDDQIQQHTKEITNQFDEIKKLYNTDSLNKQYNKVLKLFNDIQADITKRKNSI